MKQSPGIAGAEASTTGQVAAAGPAQDRGRALVALLGADQVPLLARPFFADGDPGPIVAALAQVPELLEVTAPFLGAVLGASAVPIRTKEDGDPADIGPGLVSVLRRGTHRGGT